jgi:uncharacterized delta-60 repeat protein
MKKILCLVGLLFLSMTIHASYKVGALDTTANGGAGYNSDGISTSGAFTQFYNAVAILPDGGSIGVGQENNGGGLYRCLLQQFTSNGDFVAGARVLFPGYRYAIGYGVESLPNNKAIIVGTAGVTNSSSQQNILIAQVKLGNSDPVTRDTSFGGGDGFATQTLTGTSQDVAYSVLVDSTGLIYVIGTSTQGGQGNIFIARYTSAGVLDTDFNSTGATSGGGGKTTIPGIALISISTDTLAAYAACFDQDGKIVVAGSTTASTSMLIARVTVGTGAGSGILDTTFDTDGYNIVNLGGTAVAYGIAMQLTGKFVIAGTDGTNCAIARFTTTGELDTTFGISSSGYNIANTFGGTAANAKGLVIQSDDKIVIGGNVTNGFSQFVIARYLADGSALDTGDFGAIPANGYTVTDVSSSSIANTCNAIKMVQNGWYILGGYYNNGDSSGECVTARYLGTQNVQGAIDFTYQNTPARQGFKVYPTDSTGANQPKVTAIYPAASGSLYVLSSATDTSTNSRLIKLNASGNAATDQATIAQPTPTDVITDSNDKAVTIGNTTTPKGYIARYYNNSGTMALDPTFNSESILVETTNSTSFQRVCQQSTERYVVIGQAATAANGLLIGYTSAGVLDTTFGTSSSGFITMTTATFYDLIVDSNNFMYVAFSNGTNLCLAKYLADGSALVSSFGTSGVIDTGLPIANYSTGVCLSFDNSGNIVMCAANATTSGIALQRYAPTATIAASTTTIAATTSLLSTPVITKIQCDTNNRIIFNGYENNQMFIGRCTSGTFSLDTSFAPYSSCLGILKSMYTTINYGDNVVLTVPYCFSNTVCINSNGNILCGGYESQNSSRTVSFVGQVTGYTSGTIYTQVRRFPPIPLPGVLNVDFGTNGALNLNTAPASLSAGQARAMYTLASGKILVADSNGTSTSLALLDTGYALDTASFGSGTGAVSLGTMAQATTIMTDTSGNIYVAGTTSDEAVVIYKVPSNGASASVINIPAASASAGLTSAYDIVEQASGRILIAGYNSSYAGGASGVIMAYNPVGDAVDTSFNPTGSYPGYWFTGVANPVSAIAIGNVAAYKDKIYFAYENGSSAAVVARLLENGTALDSTFSFGIAIASVSDETQIKMQLDVNGKVVLVANTGATAGVRAARYTANGANDLATATIIADASGQILEKVLAMSDGTTLILAAIPNDTATSAYISFARLTSAGFILDTTFNPSGSVPGILTTNVPSSSNTPVMKDFYTFDTILAGGFLIAGDNSQTAATAHPYFAGVENTTAPTKVSQSATSTPAAGVLDTTLNPAGTTPGFMNFAAELPTDFPTATRITSFLQQSNGTYFVGGSNGSNSYVTLMSDDDVQNSSFGTSGLLTITGKTDLAAMLIAQSGALLVVGGTGTGWVRSYNASTGTATSGLSVSTNLANHYAVAQQTTGRILVAGSSSGAVGKIIAYNSATGAVDTTFGASGTYTATGYTAIQSMIVDSLDNIYIIANDASNNAQVMCLNSNGIAVNWTTTFIATQSTLSANNHLAFNQAGNIVAVGVNTIMGSIIVRTFTPGSAGGAAGTALTLAVGATGITTPNVTSLLVDLNASPGKVIVTGYDTNTDPSTPFIMRINSGITALDTTFNTTGVQSYNALTSGVTSNWYTGMINEDGKITVGGYASALTTPYIMRVYGDEFKGQYSPSLTALTAGTPGTVDTNFGTSGKFSLNSLGAGALNGLTPQVVVPTSTGQYYISFTDGSLIRLTSGLALDTTFDTDGFASSTPAGNFSMIIDGSSQLVLAGTTSGAGWLKRYNAGLGTLDTTFNSNVTTALTTLGVPTVFTTVAQQTLGRYVVAGTMASGNGGLFAFTSTGTLDTTFNNPTTTGGWYDTGVANGVYAVTVDLYDRIVIAYKNGSNIDVVRLTSAGQLDTQFNTTGTVASAITGADAAAQVRIAIDQEGNIIVAAHTTLGISVRGLTTTGTSLYSQLDIATIITNTPVLTDLIATADGNVLLSGLQSGANPMWVARVTVVGILDLTFGRGGDGIMTFSFDGGATARALNAIAIYGDGQLAMVGTETNGTVNPFLSMAYDTPYTLQVSQSPDSKTQGTNDPTLGASTTTATNLGVIFFASAAGNATSGQVARAIGLQDDAHILVAVDGGLSAGSATPANIYLKMFDIDGVADTSFGTSGQRSVLTTYQNQNVQDMVTFTTVAGVHKALLAGYVNNTSISKVSSLLLQYNLDTHLLDTTFGGFDGNPSGIAFGDCKQINVVGQQSTGRIIASGISTDTLGLVLGYTSNGKLDASFGNGGYINSSLLSSMTGIYTHAIDTQNRILISWVDTSDSNFVKVSRFLADGSALDTTFGTGGTVSTGATTYGNNGIRVALDGSNNVFVAQVAAGQTTVTIYAYDTTGTTLYTALTPALSLTTFNITRLMIDTTGLVYVIGYDTAESDQIVIARILANLSALDTTFNPSTGYLKYAVAAATKQAATDALIHPDGRILVVGSQS